MALAPHFKAESAIFP